MKIKFEDWLRKQKHRDDPIGDLAQALIKTKSDNVEEYFLKSQPDYDELKAYELAWAEYLKHPNREEFKLVAVSASELTPEPDYPRGFFAYIDEKGYVALKNYSTLSRYDELRDSPSPLFIPYFVANSYSHAMTIIKKSMVAALNFDGNRWDHHEKKSGLK